MKRFIKSTAVVAAIIVLGTAATAYAATFKTPAQVVTEITGKTADQVNTERASGKTYGTIAKDSGKLSEFQKEMLEQKKAYLDQRVKDKTLTQEKADAIYNSIKEAQSSCDGTGQASGLGCGTGFGCGAGYGAGSMAGGCGGNSNGRGAGRGMGRGFQK